MKLFEIKAPSANRILNVWNKAYIFNDEAICLIPEEDANGLPITYKNLWLVSIDKEEIPADEITNPAEVKKIVTPSKDIKKVVEAPKADIKKTQKLNEVKK